MCENEEKDLTSLNSSLPDIAKKIDELYLKREERLRATKGRFNLFTTLLGIGDETRLHSRFITHLLNSDPEHNPNHDCRRLFLDLFIDTIFESNVLSDKNAKKTFKDIKEKKCVLARTERPADERRIDIYAKFNDAIIAIENKIWAGEQADQICDYKKYIDKVNPKPDNNFLFYLTLDGKESETSNGAEYFCLSYKEHILKWLEKCLEATYKYVNINQAIQQYQNVIKQLTHQTMENEDMKKIIKMIEEKPLIIKYQKEINDSVEILKQEWRQRFWKMLKEKLKINEPIVSSKNYEYLFSNESIQLNINDYNYDINFLIEINFVYKILIKAGLCTHKYTNENFQDKIFEKIKEKPGFDNWGVGSKWWILGAHSLVESNISSKAFIADNFSEDKLQLLVNKCVEKFEPYVKEVQNWWKKPISEIHKP